MESYRLTKLNFITPVQNGIVEVERLMHSQADGYHPDLRAAFDLLLSSGGKRIRPALTLLTGRMLGGDPRVLVTLAAAIELLHTATLVHDDLIDSSLLRRGIPTLNSQWSPGATVLTGDFIFARASKIAADTNSVAVMKLFAQTLTTIVNGELTQLFTSRCQLDRDDYYSRIYSKTASLFETSTTSAAILSGVPEATIEKLRKFGYEIGMAFQIIDDILDFTGEQSTIGKPVGSDLRQGLITLPALFYSEIHPEDPSIKPISEGRCEYHEEKMTCLIEAIRSSRAIDLSYNEACLFVQRGLSQIQNLPETPEKDALVELAEYIVQRRN